MRKSFLFVFLLLGFLFFVKPSGSYAQVDILTDFDFSMLTPLNVSGSVMEYSDFYNSDYDIFAIHSLDGTQLYLIAFPSGSSYYFASVKNPSYCTLFCSNPGRSAYRKSNSNQVSVSSSPIYYMGPSTLLNPFYVVKVSSSSSIFIDGEPWSPLPPIELNPDLTNNFTISRYRFVGYASTNARYAISTDPAPSTDCDYYWSTTFMGPDLNQVTNMLNEFRHQDSEDLEQWLVNHALDKSYRISNSVTYHHWTNEQMNTFDSRTGLFTISLPNSFIDAYDLSSVPAEDLADVQRIIYFSGYPVLVRMYYENRVTRERSPLTSVEYKPSALAFWDYAGVSDFLPDPDDQGFSYIPGELVYDADLSDVTGVLYDVNYFSGWLANIVNAMPTKSLSLAFMTFIVTIIVGVVGVVLR